MAFAYDSAKFKGQCLEIRHIAKLQDVKLSNNLLLFNTQIVNKLYRN